MIDTAEGVVPPLRGRIRSGPDRDAPPVAQRKSTAGALGRDAGAGAAVCLPEDTFLLCRWSYQGGRRRCENPRDRYFGKITPSQMDPTQQSQDLLDVTASMRTALLVYGGINVKMMVDSDLGAQLSTMFMVQYDPDGATGPHDHPFEETYFFLEGEAEATFDGKPVVLGAGDIACRGGLSALLPKPRRRPLRWLETQAPQPPRSILSVRSRLGLPEGGTRMTQPALLIVGGTLGIGGEIAQRYAETGLVSRADQPRRFDGQVGG